MLKQAATGFLRLTGWSVGARPPDLPKYVIVSQHTSNWDGWYFLWYSLVFGLRASFVAKHSLFWGPFGPLLRSLGGVAVDRSQRHDLVSQLVDEFERRDRFVLAIAPEGTRGYADHWKSGFYQVAVRAKVPIVPGLIDYGRRRGGFAEPIWPTGDIKADMDRVRAAYADVRPKRPRDAGPVRLKEEA